MVFVNEYISEDDKNKYKLDEIDQRFIVGGTKARDWTIDREKNIYLRVVSRGREEFFHESKWTFYWDGELIILDIELKSSFGGVGEDAGSHKCIRNLKIPDYLKSRKKELLADLKESFEIYKDGGVFSKSASYSLTLDCE